MKTYKCPYCNKKLDRLDLIAHIDEEHTEMIPENHSPPRLVFNIVNKKEHGTCMVCGAETTWDENNCKYKKVCGKKECKEYLREQYRKNMIRVRGTDNILNDMGQQSKMLANRKISGTYTFTDGGKKTYTGSYEKKTLEFFDKALNIDSDDLICPGPIFEYEYQGKKLKWITDMLYVPYNLIIEVKDGGDNPNTRQMDTYREKQYYKEKIINTEKFGTYSYLRLTNNNFLQLLEIMMELKKQMIDDSAENKRISLKRIHESGGGMPPDWASKYYLVAYGYKNAFVDDIEGFALQNDLITDKILIIKDGVLTSESSSFLDGRATNIYQYLGDSANVKNILEEAINKKNLDDVNQTAYLYEQLSGKDMLSKDQMDYDELFEQVYPEKLINPKNVTINTLLQEYKMVKDEPLNYLPVMNNDDLMIKKDLLENYNHLDILEDMDGYFIFNQNTLSRGASYKDIKDVIIDENITEKYKPGEEGISDSYVLINRDNIIYESKNKQDRTLKVISENSVDTSWKDALGLIEKDMRVDIENLKVKKLKSLYRIKVNTEMNDNA